LDGGSTTEDRRVQGDTVLSTMQGSDIRMLGSFGRRTPVVVCGRRVAAIYKFNVSLIHEIRHMDTYSAKRPICHTEVLKRDFHKLITSKHIKQIQERWDGNGAVVGSKIRAIKH
jgi:hypothetical protein